MRSILREIRKRLRVCRTCCTIAGTKEGANIEVSRDLSGSLATKHEVKSKR
jgi:hypothetical protein